MCQGPDTGYTSSEMVKRLAGMSKKIDRFHNDEFINAVTKQMMNVYSCSMPKLIIYESGLMSREYPEETLNLIKKLEGLRDEYIRMEYGNEFIVKINEE